MIFNIRENIVPVWEITINISLFFEVVILNSPFLCFNNYTSILKLLQVIFDYNKKR